MNRIVNCFLFWMCYSLKLKKLNNKFSEQQSKKIEINTCYWYHIFKLKARSSDSAKKFDLISMSVNTLPHAY
jgi:hypothetical protein